MNSLFIYPTVAAQFLYLSFLAISHTYVSLLHSAPLYSHSNPSTINDGPNTSSLTSHNDEKGVSKVYLSKNPLHLIPNTSAVSIVSNVYDLQVCLTLTPLSNLSDYIAYISAAYNTQLCLLSISGIDISDKILYDTCIHRSYALTYETCSYVPPCSSCRTLQGGIIYYFSTNNETVEPIQGSTT